MSTRPALDLANIAADTPLRLEVAARLAFPDGSMTKSGLHREIKRGRLAYEEIAGKFYVTLNDIDRMRQLCRANRKVQGSISGSALGDLPSTSSSTEVSKSAQAAAQMIANKLKKPSANISAKSTGLLGATVIPMR